MNDETKKILQQFLEKAQKLKEFRFDEHVRSIGLKLNAYQTESGNFVCEFGLPDVKEQDAYLLTFRMFIQKNEPISFVNIHSLLKDNDLSNEFREGIKTVRRTFFDYLNGYSNYTVNLFEGHPTRRQMLETVLYGGLAHGNNEETVHRFKDWSRDDIRANLLMQEFAGILLKIDLLIKLTAILCEKELNKNSSD